MTLQRWGFSVGRSALTAPVTPRFANIQHLLAFLTQDMFGGPEHTDSETPDDFTDRLPFARFMRVDGSRSALFDYPVVEVDVFSLTEAEGEPLAADLCDFLLRKPPPHPAIDLAFCDPAPRELPWGDGSIRRWNATYAFELRRTRLLQ